MQFVPVLGHSDQREMTCLGMCTYRSWNVSGASPAYEDLCTSTVVCMNTGLYCLLRASSVLP